MNSGKDAVKNWRVVFAVVAHDFLQSCSACDRTSPAIRGVGRNLGDPTMLGALEEFPVEKDVDDSDGGHNYPVPGRGSAVGCL